MGNTFKSFGLSLSSWIMAHKALSVCWFFLTLSFLTGDYRFLAPAILFFLIHTNNLMVVIGFLGEQLKIVLSWIIKVMTGGYGKRLALIVNGGAFLSLGFFIGGNNGQSLALIGTLIIVYVIFSGWMTMAEKLPFFKPEKKD